MKTPKFFFPGLKIAKAVLSGFKFQVSSFKFRLSGLLLASLLLSLAAPARTDAAETGTCSVEIQFIGYTNAETLTNFPAVLVFTNGTTNVMWGGTNAGFQYREFSSTNGWDLRFTDSTQTTNLNYEIESWNTNGSSYVWVQLPALTNNSYIWAYWGGSYGTTQAVYTTNGATWSNAFVLVEHLNEGSGTTIHDSSTNHYGAGTHSAFTWITNGIADGAIDLGSSGQNGVEMTGGNPAVGSSWTVSACVRNLCNSGGTRVLFDAQGDDVDEHIVLNSSDQLCVYINGSYGTMNATDTGATLTPASCANTWRQVTAVGSGSDTLMYLDGIYVGKVSGHKPTQAVRCIGYRDSQTGYDWGWQCATNLDEVRVQNVIRSSNWIWATYLNIASNSLFWTNAAASVAASAPVITNSAPTNITSTSAFMNGSVTSTGALPTMVWLFWGTSSGGANFTSWANTNNLGTNATGTVTTNITSLSAGTQYYYTYYATNTQGQVWATPVTNFTTLSMPVITNAAATNITSTTAWMNGSVTSTGGAPTMVWLFWGRLLAGLTSRRGAIRTIWGPTRPERLRRTSRAYYRARHITTRITLQTRSGRSGRCRLRTSRQARACQ